MSFITAIGKNIITPVAKRVVKFTHITDPIQRQVAQDVSVGAENLTRLVKEVSPEQLASVQKYFKPFERYGFSQGDIKYLIQQNPEMVENLELIADKKLIDAVLKRKDLVKDGLLGCVTKENKKAFIRLLRDNSITDEEFKFIANLITEENAPILKQLLKDKNFNSKILADLPTTHLTKDNVEVLRAISGKGNVSTQEMLYIMTSTNKSNSDIALKLLERGGENTGGLNLILHNVYAFEGMSKEGLEAFKLRKNFISELLENPNFKLGKDEMENYNISQVLSVLKPENFNMAQKALLERKIDLHQLSDFLKGVTSENQEIAERLLNLASKDTKLPDIEYLNPETATKYLDEVVKINNPEAQNFYIEAMNGLDERKFDEILNIIRTTKPENAKHASTVIGCMNYSSKSAAEIEPIVCSLEQSGRNLSANTISNLTVLSGIEELPVAQFIERIVKNKTIPDNELYFLTNKYISVAQKVKSQGFSTRQIKEDLRLGKITQNVYNSSLEKLMTEFEQKPIATVEKLPEILEKLYQNKSLSHSQVSSIFSEVSMDNISLVEKYALSPKIAKINLTAIEPKYAQDLEHLLKLDVPGWHQKELLPVLKSSEKGGEKRLEVLQELLKREKEPSIKTIAEAVGKVDEKTLQYIDDIIARKDLTPKQVLFVLDHIQWGNNVENLMKLVKDAGLKGKYFEQVFAEGAYKMYEQYPELTKKALELKVPLQVWNPKGSFDNRYTAITDVIGEKRLTNMLKGIEQAKKEYGIVPEDLYLADLDGANDLFIVLKQTDKRGRLNLAYKFNKKTGNLVTINQGGKTIHVKKGTQVYDSVATEVKTGNAPATPFRINSVTEGKNGKFGTVYTESVVKGQYDIYHTRPDGSRIRIGHAQITPNGAKHVRRTLTSTDGSKTYTAFREDKTGNSYLHSVITDKTGKQISEVTRTFKVVSKNHFVSTVNGRSYDIMFTDKKVVVTKLDSMGKKTAEKVEYAIADIPVDTANIIARELEAKKCTEKTILAEARKIFQKHSIRSHTIDRSCVDMLKRLPGDEWFAMSKSCEFVMPQSFMPENACYAGNSIFMSKELNNNLGVFAHELGHAKFHVLDLRKDKELMKIYNAEKRAYTAKFPESRIESIEYFLTRNDAGKRGLNEACAETNLMTDTIQTWEQLQDRTIFLEQYFPNTVAHIRKRYSAFA